MRTALLTAMLLLSPLAMAEDDVPLVEGEGTEEPAAEEEEEEGLPEVDEEKAIEVCKPLRLMEYCEIDALVGLCKLETCQRGWKDGAPRACKQCVPHAYKPIEEPEPVAEEAAAEVPASDEPKGTRRVKKRDCGCNASASPISALGLAFMLPIVARRRKS